MKISKQQAWIAAGVVFGAYLLSNLLGGSSAPAPIGPGYVPYGQENYYGQGGYDPAWYGEYGTPGYRPGDSASSGYGMTGAEVFDNPDATDWRDRVFIAE
jgi:hypothetical protein